MYSTTDVQCYDEFEYSVPLKYWIIACDSYPVTGNQVWKALVVVKWKFGFKMSQNYSIVRWFLYMHFLSVCSALCHMVITKHISFLQNIGYCVLKMVNRNCCHITLLVLCFLSPLWPLVSSFTALLLNNLNKLQVITITSK